MAYDKARECVVLQDLDSSSTWEWRGAGWQKRDENAQVWLMTFSETDGRCLAISDQATLAWDGESWSQVAPSPVFGVYAMAHDRHRQRTVFVGGSLPLETWEFDGATWQLVPTATHPPFMWHPAMVFDSVRNRTVLFGGGTWEWDGVQWIQRQPANSPAGSASYGGVFDTSRGVMVVPIGSEVWEWDGVDWSSTPAPNGPQAAHGRLAYDETRSEVVAVTMDFLGAVSTWTWDGSSWALRDERAAGVPAGLALATDPVQQQVLAFGGTLPGYWGAVSLDQTLRWDGSGWVHLPATVAPPPRSGAHLFFNTSSAQVTMFGGLGATTYNDLWEWNGSGWDPIATTTAPPWRPNSTVVFDEQRGCAVLFGGGWPAHSSTYGGPIPATLLADTWEWDGVDWTLRSPAIQPGARLGHCMAYDAARGRTVLFGGLTSTGGSPETWEWDGVDWQLCPSVTSPPGGPGGAMVFDPARGEVLLRKGGLWSWDGIDWTQLSVSLGSVTATSRSMAVDPATGALLMPIHRNAGLQTGTQLIGDVVAASSISSGAGCSNGATVPSLRIVRPLLGTTVACELLDAAPASLALLLFSPDAGSISVAGCALHLGTVLTPMTVSTNGYGVGVHPIAVPYGAALRGLQLHAQAAVLDPGAAHGFTLSDARRIIIGDGE